jgi:hypothetical protein
VNEKKKPPPKDAGEYSAFKRLLDRVAKVPKAEIERREREYQDEREKLKKKAR